jgi:hypothetical protein
VLNIEEPPVPPLPPATPSPEVPEVPAAPTVNVISPTGEIVDLVMKPEPPPPPPAVFDLPPPPPPPPPTQTTVIGLFTFVQVPEVVYVNRTIGTSLYDEEIIPRIGIKLYPPLSRMYLRLCK